MRRLGGWWRLWIALSGLWFFGAAAIAIAVIYDDLGTLETYLSKRPEACGRRLGEHGGQPAADSGPWTKYQVDHADKSSAALMTALRNADAAGDAEGARRIAATIKAEKAKQAMTKQLEAGNGAMPPLPEGFQLDSDVSYRERCTAHWKERFWSESSIGAAIAALPPLAILLLGALSGWIWRGFRNG